MEDTVSYISPKTFADIIEYIPNLRARKLKPYDIEMLYKILYYCALRANEGIRLKKEDISLINREIWLGKTKTKKGDKTAIPKIFTEELKEYLNTKDKGRLFPKLTYHLLWEWLTKTGKALDIEAFNTPEKISGSKTKSHIFRKTLAQNCLNGLYGEKMKDIPLISKHLRHSKPSMTVDYYLKSTVTAVKENF